MKHGIGLNKILGTIHIYPTLAEGNKYAGGQLEESARTAKAAQVGGKVPRVEARLKISIIVPR